MNVDIATYGFALSLLSALAGLLWIVLWQILKDLRADVRDLTQQVADLRVLIAAEGVRNRNANTVERACN